MSVTNIMTSKKEKTQVEIAREALFKLTQDKIPLTPDSFRLAYEKISGISSREDEFHLLTKTLAMVFQDFVKGKPNAEIAYKAFLNAIEERKWNGAEAELAKVLTKSTINLGMDLSLTWRDLMIQVLELGLLTQFKNIPELARKTSTLIDQAKVAASSDELTKLNAAFKTYWRKIETNQKVQAEMQGSLMKLFRLLVSNMQELSENDHVMDGQIAMLTDLLNQPMSEHTFNDAENNLRALLARQKVLKKSLVEAKQLLKELAKNCVGILSEVTEETGEYHEKIVSYQKEIEATDDICALKSVLENLKRDTNNIYLGTKLVHQKLKETHARVAAADELIDKLSNDLDQASQLAYRDFLTGALNRRGMEDALLREFARADRTGHPLCLAMLDIDHFKQINDSLGHDAGDEAIMHLATITQMALRPTDVLSRYGGEEFLIILPDTPVETGVQVLTRVQRELTKNLFLHQNEKRLITFSAGVSQRLQGEDSDPVLKRVDTALYHAKGNGRNQVISA